MVVGRHVMEAVPELPLCMYVALKAGKGFRDVVWALGAL